MFLSQTLLSLSFISVVLIVSMSASLYLRESSHASSSQTLSSFSFIHLILFCCSCLDFVFLWNLNFSFVLWLKKCGHTWSGRVLWCVPTITMSCCHQFHCNCSLVVSHWDYEVTSGTIQANSQNNSCCILYLLMFASQEPWQVITPPKSVTKSCWVSPWAIWIIPFKVTISVSFSTYLSTNLL